MLAGNDLDQLRPRFLEFSLFRLNLLIFLGQQIATTRPKTGKQPQKPPKWLYYGAQDAPDDISLFFDPNSDGHFVLRKRRDYNFIITVHVDEDDIVPLGQWDVAEGIPFLIAHNVAYPFRPVFPIPGHVQRERRRTFGTVFRCNPNIPLRDPTLFPVILVIGSLENTPGTTKAHLMQPISQSKYMYVFIKHSTNIQVPYNLQ